MSNDEWWRRFALSFLYALNNLKSASISVFETDGKVMTDQKKQNTLIRQPHSIFAIRSLALKFNDRITVSAAQFLPAFQVGQFDNKGAFQYLSAKLFHQRGRGCYGTPGRH